MTQITIHIKDESIIPTLTKVIRAFDGVSIKKRSSYEQSKYEASTGQVKRFETTEALFADLEA